MSKNTAMNESLAVRPVTPNEVYENKGLVIEVGRRLRWDYHSCQDLVQEVALKCWRNRRIVFDPSKGTFAGFLARIARNTAIDIWRKNRHLPIPTDDVELVRIADNENDDTPDAPEQEKRHELLERGIDEMYRRFPSKDSNDAFVMFSRNGMHANEVAKELGVEERFVNVAVHRGLKRLTEIVRRLEREEQDMRHAG